MLSCLKMLLFMLTSFQFTNLDHNMSQRKQALEVMSDSCELFANHAVLRHEDRLPPPQLGLYVLMCLKLAEKDAVHRLHLIICILSVLLSFCCSCFGDCGNVIMKSTWIILM